MGKYTPLRLFLVAQDVDIVPMTFADVERILSITLPASKQYPAWWSNNASNNPMTREWLKAGFATESVNIAGERLVFRRVRNEPKSGFTDQGSNSAASVARHPLFGCLKGILTIAPGVDLTEPADPDLADYLDWKYGADLPHE